MGGSLRFRHGVAYDAKAQKAYVCLKISVRQKGPNGEDLRDERGRPVVKIHTKTGTFTGPQAKERALHAVAMLKAARRNERMGLPAPELAARDRTLRDAFEDFILAKERLGKSPEYLEQIRYVQGVMGRALGEGCPVALTEQHFERFVAWMRASTRSKGRAIAQSIAITRMVLKRAKVAIPDTPRIEVPKRAPKSVPLEQLRRFLAALPPGGVPRVAAEIALRLSIRPAEVERLRVGDVDLAHRRILVRHHKGQPGSRAWEEWYPLPPELEKVLRAYLPGVLEYGPAAPLLGVWARRGRKKGKRASGALVRHELGSSSLRRPFHEACVAAGITTPNGLTPRGGLHWLRHEATTLASQDDAAVKHLVLNLGHADNARMVFGHYAEDARLEREVWRAREILQGNFAETLSGAPRARRRGRP